MRQKSDIEFNVEMKCISLIHYISNHLKQYVTPSLSSPSSPSPSFSSLYPIILITHSLSPFSLPLSIVTRLLNTHGKSVIVCLHFFK